MCKNIKGEDGVINLKGKLGFPSAILNIDDEDFYDNIEDGIKSTVETIIDAGFKTITSCEGHHHPSFCLRCVSICLNESELDPWMHMISDINITNRFDKPITYNIVDDGNSGTVLQIHIGSVYNLEDTEKKQDELNKAIPSIRKVYYPLFNRNFKKYLRDSGHVNIFTRN